MDSPSILKLPAFLKLTNTDPFAAWFGANLGLPENPVLGDRVGLHVQSQELPRGHRVVSWFRA